MDRGHRETLERDGCLHAGDLYCVTVGLDRLGEDATGLDAIDHHAVRLDAQKWKPLLR